MIVDGRISDGLSINLRKDKERVAKEADEKEQERKLVGDLARYTISSSSSIAVGESHSNE